MNLYVLDSGETLLTVVPIDINTAGEHVPVFEAKHNQQVQGEDTLELLISAEHEQTTHMVEGNKLAYQDPDEPNLWHMFTIMKVVSTHDDELTNLVIAENVWYELMYDPIEDERPEDLYVQDVMAILLRDTIWNVGTVASSIYDRQTMYFYYTNVLTSLRRLEGTYAGEIRFRLLYNDTSKRFERYVDFVEEVGQIRGKQFTFDKDISSIEREANILDLYTALYGRGNTIDSGDGSGNDGRLSFASVEWSLANGDPTDKPLGQEWVGSLWSLQNFGRQGGTMHRTGFHTEENVSNAEELLIRTWNQLLQMNKPKVTYQMKVIDLYRASDHDIDLVHERVELGDYVVVVDKHFALPFKEQVRVMEIKKDLIQKENTEIVLGNHLEDGISSDIDLDTGGDEKPINLKASVIIDIEAEQPYGVTLPVHDNRILAPEPFIQAKTYSPPLNDKWKILVVSNGNNVAPMHDKLTVAGHLVSTLEDSQLYDYNEKFLKGFNLVILSANAPNAKSYDFEAPMIVHHGGNAVDMGMTEAYQLAIDESMMWGQLDQYDPDRYDIFDGISVDGYQDQVVLGPAGTDVHTITVSTWRSPILKVAGTVTEEVSDKAVLAIPNRSYSETTSGNKAFFGVTHNQDYMYEDTWLLYVNVVEYMISYFKPQILQIEPDETTMVENFGTAVVNTYLPSIEAVDNTSVPSLVPRANILVISDSGSQYYTSSKTALTTALEELRADYQHIDDNVLNTVDDAYLSEYNFIIMNGNTFNANSRTWSVPMIINNSGIALTNVYELGDMEAGSNGSYVPSSYVGHEVFKYTSSPNSSSQSIGTGTSLDKGFKPNITIFIEGGSSYTNYDYTLGYNRVTKIGYFGREDLGGMSTNGKAILKGFIEFMANLPISSDIKPNTIRPTAQGNVPVIALSDMNAMPSVNNMSGATVTGNAPSLDVNDNTIPTVTPHILITHDRYYVNTGSQNEVQIMASQLGWQTTIIETSLLEGQPASFYDPYTMIFVDGRSIAVVEKIRTINKPVLTNSRAFIFHANVGMSGATHPNSTSLKGITVESDFVGHEIFVRMANPNASAYTNIHTGAKVYSAFLDASIATDRPELKRMASTTGSDYENLGYSSIAMDINKRVLYFGLIDLTCLTTEGRNLVKGMLEFTNNSL